MRPVLGFWLQRLKGERNVSVDLGFLIQLVLFDKLHFLIIKCNSLRLEENPMPRLFGYGPERETFEHLAHKVMTTSFSLLYINISDIVNLTLQSIPNSFSSICR